MVERSSDMDERLEALQDDVDLLKNEVKQTLVDLREMVMKERTLLPNIVQAAPQRPPADGSARDDLSAMPVALQGLPTAPVSGLRRQIAPLRDLQSQAHSSGALDAVMLGNIIWWLGTVKRRGLSLQQLTPFLEAYEMSGHLTPSMAKLMLRTMADLDDLEETPRGHVFSPQDYTECLLQLHDIICTPGYVVDRLVTQEPVRLPESGPQPSPAEGEEQQDSAA